MIWSTSKLSFKQNGYEIESIITTQFILTIIFNRDSWATNFGSVVDVTTIKYWPKRKYQWYGLCGYVMNGLLKRHVIIPIINYISSSELRPCLSSRIDKKMWHDLNSESIVSNHEGEREREKKTSNADCTLTWNWFMSLKYC